MSLIEMQWGGKRIITLSGKSAIEASYQVDGKLILWILFVVFD